MQQTDTRSERSCQALSACLATNLCSIRYVAMEYATFVGRMRLSDFVVVAVAVSVDVDVNVCYSSMYAAFRIALSCYSPSVTVVTSYQVDVSMCVSSKTNFKPDHSLR